MNSFGRIFRNTAILAASQLISKLGSVVLAFFVARILHATGLGIYAGAMAIYDLVAVTGEMGVSNLLVREVGKDHSNTNRYMVHLGSMAAGVSAILMFAFLIALPHLNYSPELTGAMYIVILGMIPGTLNSVQEGVFVAHQRVEFITLTTSFTTLFNVLFSLYLLLTGHGIISLVISFVVTQCVVTLIYFLFINRYIARIRWEFDLHFAIDLAREIKTFAAIATLAAFFSRPEVIVLTLVSTAAQTGFYSAGLRVFNITQLFPQMYLTNVFPIFSRAFQYKDNSLEVIQDRTTRYIAAFTLPLAVGIAVAAGPIIRLLYGPGFEPSVPVLQVLAINIPLSACFAIFWRVLFARHRQDMVFKGMLISTALELVGDFIFISRWGAFGAAIIGTAVSLVYSLLLVYFVHQDGSRARPVQESWRFGAAAAGMGVVLWAISRVIDPSRELTVILLAPAGLVSFAVFVHLFKAFAPEDLAFIREFLDTRIPRGLGRWLPWRGQRSRFAEENTMPGK